MWLLNTSTFKLEEFYSDVPSYAILSHRWKKDEEVSFGGLEEPHPQSNRTGYKKIKDFCREAQKKRFAYVWVDTCCIDKKSSAELSEAINSMYTYYSRAEICYVHLYDVDTMEDFDKSSWFTRGWTLQELLAPSKLHFFNRVWKPIGSRRQLASRIQKITAIPIEALQKLQLDKYCIADRLSWSAKRQTTREEDRAYSLLGLFKINMPLLYGEGTRAFQRLQEEIMKTSTDGSIFLWQGSAVESFGMFASDPSCFVTLPDPDVKQHIKSNKTLLSMGQGWHLNNTGIDVVARLSPYLLTRELECIYALEVHDPWARIRFPNVIFVRRHAKNSGVPAFTRVSTDGVTWESDPQIRNNYPFVKYAVEKVRLLRQPLQEIYTTPDETREFEVIFNSEVPIACAAYQRPCNGRNTKLRLWQEIRHLDDDWRDFSFSINPRAATGLFGYLLLTLTDDIQILICLGASWDFQPVCIALPLCKKNLAKGLECLSVLREYERIAEGQRSEFSFFDTEIHMVGLCEDDGAGLATTIGLDISLYITHFRSGKLNARINFDIARFIQYYVPTVDSLTYDFSSCIPPNVRNSLLFAEQRINERRRLGGLIQ